jgi:hypothetical protein
MLSVTPLLRVRVEAAVTKSDGRGYPGGDPSCEPTSSRWSGRRLTSVERADACAGEVGHELGAALSLIPGMLASGLAFFLWVMVTLASAPAVSRR